MLRKLSRASGWAAEGLTLQPIVPCIFAAGVLLFSGPLMAQTDSPPVAPEAAPQSILPGILKPAPAPSTETPSPPPAPALTPPDQSTPTAATNIVVDLSREQASYGPLTGTFGLGQDVWSGADGRTVTALLRRLRTPLGSRYGHILLRRLLMTQAAPPNGADLAPFMAARAHALLRMGEVEAAAMLVNAIPVATYDRSLYTVATQVHLAGGDIGATCPMVERALLFSTDTQWPLLSALCSVLAGDDGGAAQSLDLARQEGHVNRFDLALTEAAVTAIAGGGRGGTISWPVGGLFTSFRIGVGFASGQNYPDWALIAAPSAVQAWLVRQASIDNETRFRLAWTAASIGVLSADEFVSLWAARGSGLDERARAYRPEGLLITAANSASLDDRRRAMQRLWDLGRRPHSRLAMLLVTSDAAARYPVRRDQAAYAPELLRSLLLGGRLSDVARWAPVLKAAGGDAFSKAWPMLFFAAPDTVRPTADLIDSWRDAQSGNDAKLRRQLLVAAMQGLGFATSQRALPAPADPLFGALENAARKHQRGSVVLLASQALAPGWANLTPAALKAVVAALVQVGLARDARLIAAETLIMTGG